MGLITRESSSQYDAEEQAIQAATTAKLRADVQDQIARGETPTYTTSFIVDRARGFNVVHPVEVPAGIYICEITLTAASLGGAVFGSNPGEISINPYPDVRTGRTLLTVVRPPSETSEHSLNTIFLNAFFEQNTFPGSLPTVPLLAFIGPVYSVGWIGLHGDIRDGSDSTTYAGADNPTVTWFATFTKLGG